MRFKKDGMNNYFDSVQDIIKEYSDGHIRPLRECCETIKHIEQKMRNLIHIDWLRRILKNIITLLLGRMKVMIIIFMNI